MEACRFIVNGFVFPHVLRSRTRQLFCVCPMREIVSIFCGQAGIQIGESCWDLYAAEHHIGQDGKPLKDFASFNHHPETLFTEHKDGRYEPRAFYIDTEPSVLNSFKETSWGQLCSPDRMRCTPSSCYSSRAPSETSSSNFAVAKYLRMNFVKEPKGHFGIIESFKHVSLTDQMRLLLEGCDCPDGVQFVGSAEGGAGGGLTALCLEEWQKDNGFAFDKNIKLMPISLLPSHGFSSGPLATYNALHTLSYLLEATECAIVMDNESLIKSTMALPGCAELFRERLPNYGEINSVIAHVISATHATQRLGFATGSLQDIVRQFECGKWSALLTPSIAFASKLGDLSPLLADMYANPLLSCGSSAPDLRMANVKKLAEPVKQAARIPIKRFNERILVRSTSHKHPGDAIRHLKADLRSEMVIPPTITCLPRPVAAAPGSLFAGKNLDHCAVGFSNSTLVAKSVHQSIIGSAMELCYGRQRDYVHTYVREGMEEGEFWEARENIQAYVDSMFDLARDDSGGKKEAAK